MFSKQILFAATVLATTMSSASATKWDCWSTLDCAKDPELLTTNGCLCDGSAAEPAACKDLDFMNVATETRCFQSLTYEGCFAKGALSASIWGDEAGTPTSGMDVRCWMNKYDCWTDCECQANGSPVPLNTMGGNGLTGADTCFAGAGSAAGSSACVWGHCPWNGPSYVSTFCNEGESAPCGNPVTVDHECEANKEHNCGGTWGDPHFKMWDGESYDYHGACDLVFLDAPTMNMTIQVRTTIRYDYSYISAAVVSVNGETIEVGGFGSVMINGVYGADDREVAKTVGGYPLSVVTSNKKTHTYRLELENGQWIELKSYKDLVGVSLDLLHEGVKDSQGLMGSVQNGDKLGRDGVTVFTDLNEFGQEWQVGSSDAVLFDADADFPGEKCRLPKVAFAETRRLGEGIARSEAEAACAHMKLNKAACISDVMSTGDMGIAGAF